MSERPKIKIKLKDNTGPEPKEEVVSRERKIASMAESQVHSEPLENTPKDHVVQEPKYQERPVQNETTHETYDYYSSSPNSWITYGFYFSAGINIILLGYLFILPLFSGNNIEPQPVEFTTNVNKTKVFIKDYFPPESKVREDIIDGYMGISELLSQVGVAAADLSFLEQEAAKYSIIQLGPGDKYSLASSANEETLQMLIIEPKLEPYVFYKFNLDKDLAIEQIRKNVEIKESSIAGIVNGTLGNTFMENNLNLQLISDIEEVLAWTVDLFNVGDGDRFKVLYEEEIVNGKTYKINKINAIYFRVDNKEYYAFNYNNGNSSYFDEFGRAMERSFLATPIKYGGVITSGYGLRVHPVTGHAKAHLGTDFAAPEGTEIQAVADGIVTIASSTANNGNYIKLKHDKMYETQYLHMQKFADGIRAGVPVKQGQIIGYVGTTGMSTGPHVCYRFWKNNQQVDPMEENLASVKKIAPDLMEEYSKDITPLMEKLEAAAYN